MAKVTTKLQVTVPRALAELHGIAAGDDIDWQSAGDAIRIVPSRAKPGHNRAERARLFDQATMRHRHRKKAVAAGTASGRGWTREDLYDRGRAR